MSSTLEVAHILLVPPQVRGAQPRAVDGSGQTIEYMLSATRDKKAAWRFFRQALSRRNIRNRGRS
jgi:hypothetical protein